MTKLDRRSDEGVNHDPGVDVSFLGKILSPKNGLCDLHVTGWSHDREDRPLHEEGAVADTWK